MTAITIASPARQLANAANAQKSTGPKTAEGKARSRANAYQHGLAGEGVVQSPEDAAEVAGRYAELAAELKPFGPVAEMLVQRIASSSVRLERSVVQEAKHLSRRCRHAEADHMEMIQAQVVALLDDLDENPATSARRLLRTPEGIEAAIATWLGLKADLQRDSPRAWTARHGELAVNLTGRRLGDVPIAPIERISSAVIGDFGLLDRSEGPGLDDEARQTWARRQLAAIIDAEVEALRACFDRLDHESFQLDRVEAPIRALFDPSKEATLARRYEAAAERVMFRSLRDLRDFQKTQAETLKSPPAYQDKPLASLRAAKVAPAKLVEPMRGREEMGEVAVVRPSPAPIRSSSPMRPA